MSRVCLECNAVLPTNDPAWLSVPRRYCSNACAKKAARKRYRKTRYANNTKHGHETAGLLRYLNVRP
jgi:hypothetical protein